MAGELLQPDPAGVKFGPFWLTPGVTRLNASVYFVSSFAFVTLVTFLNFVQPYVLEEVLHVPVDQQGSVTGYLNFLHEGTALLLMGFAGALSDRTGRRAVLIAGFLVLAAGFALFPLAGTLTELYLYRLVCAVGIAVASVMVIATMQDCPQDVSRGKWGGFNSFLTSFAILVVTLGLARLPGTFAGMGYSAVDAGRLTFWVGAGMTLVAAGLCRFAFAGGQLANAAAARSPLSGFAEGIRAAARSPRLALSYASAFAARGDLVVIGAFYSLWFRVAGGERGLDSAEALKAGGISLSAMLLANVIWAPVFGIIMDRINRVVGLCIAMGLATVGYFALGSVADPYDMPVMMSATFLLGIGEISAIVAGNALLGQEAPARIRGASVGVFSLTGTLGILTATVMGGIVFDAFGPGAPFLMMAGVNLVIVMWALAVVFAGHHRPPAPAPAIGVG